MLGHGASAKPAGPYRLDDFVEQLRRVADGLDLRKFVLAGFSMGGLVAQGFALAAPVRVERLVLLNTVFDRSPQERAAVEARVREVLNGGHESGIAAALERWFTPAFRAARPEVIAGDRRRMETQRSAGLCGGLWPLRHGGSRAGRTHRRHRDSDHGRHGRRRPSVRRRRWRWRWPSGCRAGAAMSSRASAI